MEQLVIFEGVSGSGKTTLFTPVHEARSYEDLHVHRFTPTHWVMAQLYARSVELSQLRTLEEELQKTIPTLVVWCRPPPLVAKGRKLAEGDPNVLEHDFEKVDRLFEEYLTRRTAFDRVMELDTNNLSVDECVELIVKELVEHEGFGALAPKDLTTTGASTKRWV